MVEGLPISEPFKPATPLNELAKQFINDPVKMLQPVGLQPIVGNVGTDSEVVQKMANETLTGCLEAAFKASGLERTPENTTKVFSNLVERFQEWIRSGDFVVRDIDTKDLSKKYLDQACIRKGLPINSDSYAKIIKELQ